MPSGGWQQRYQRGQWNLQRSRSPRRASDVFSCEASIGHLYDWAMGVISAPRLRRHMRNICNDAVKDGRSPDMVASLLEKIGSRNGHGDLMNSLPLLGFDFRHLVSHADVHFFKDFVEPHKLLKFHLSDAPRPLCATHWC